MNIDAQVAHVERLLKQVEDIRDRIKSAAEQTQNVLDVCKAMGVNRIGIGKRDETFKDSKDWPFGEEGNIFVDGGAKNKWPLAWAVADAAKIGGGAGNSGQFKVRGEYLDGIYVCKKGVWEKQ